MRGTLNIIAHTLQRPTQRICLLLWTVEGQHSGLFVDFNSMDFRTNTMKFTAEVVVRFMESDLFHTIGVPKIIVFDNGSQFRFVVKLLLIFILIYFLF